MAADAAPAAWQAFMLLASYVFYAWWDWRFVFLLAGSTVGNYLAAAAIHRTARPRPRRRFSTSPSPSTWGCSATSSTPASSSRRPRTRLTSPGLPSSAWALSVTLPIGISFFTFMAMSYVIDIYRGELEPVDFPRFAVYLSFFPHLVAGPIVAGSELLPQLDRPRDPRPRRRRREPSSSSSAVCSSRW